MTRREAREHCFKMLFCQDFYPAEEKEEQLERYFEAPVEDVTGEDGTDEILHKVNASILWRFWIISFQRRPNPSGDGPMRSRSTG